MNDDDLLEHLVGSHPGAQMPWFTGSGWIERMRPDQLQRLHDELHHQGETHVELEVADPPATERAPVAPVPKGPCSRPWCRALAARPDGLCLAHGAEV